MPVTVGQCRRCGRVREIYNHYCVLPTGCHWRGVLLYERRHWHGKHITWTTGTQHERTPVHNSAVKP